MRFRDALGAAITRLPHHRGGLCAVCGRRTVFLCTDPRTARNNMLCVFCRSSSRQRHVARVLVEVLGGMEVAAQIRRRSTARIYNTDCTGALARVLRSYEGCVSSGLFPGKALGEQIDERVYNEDLQHLSFDDDTFDAVLSEDVFEHVRRAEEGFHEVWRVLKPGGHHIFTVPFNFDRETLIRVDTSGDEDVHLLPPEYHGDKIRGRILAYRTFGIDMFRSLKDLGFDNRVVFSSYPDRRYGVFDSYVFVSKKIERAGT